MALEVPETSVLKSLGGGLTLLKSNVLIVGCLLRGYLGLLHNHQKEEQVSPEGDLSRCCWGDNTGHSELLARVTISPPLITEGSLNSS